MHHTVTANEYSRAHVPAAILAVCRFHRNTNGWNDIGYNFVVDRFGQIWEARAGGIDEAVMGSHAQGYNSQTTGIANLGTFTSVPQSDAAISAMARLIRWKLGNHGVRTGGTVEPDLRGRLVRSLPVRRQAALPADPRPPRHRRDLVPGRAALLPAAGAARARRRAAPGRRGGRDDGAAAGAHHLFAARGPPTPERSPTATASRWRARPSSFSGCGAPAGSALEEAFTDESGNFSATTQVQAPDRSCAGSSRATTPTARSAATASAVAVAPLMTLDDIDDRRGAGRAGSTLPGRSPRRSRRGSGS